MRVLVVADIVGGVRTFVSELAAALSARGLELHLALLGPRAEAGSLRDLPLASCEVREDLRLEWMPGGMEDVQRISAWLEELCERHRPQVAQLNTFTPLPCAPVPVLLTVHSCVLTWWRAVHRHDAPPQWEGYRRLASAALTRAAAVVSPTRALLDQLQGVYGPLPGARVIPNCSSAPAAAGEAGTRERLVLSAGRLWDQAKNVAALVAAAPGIEAEVAVIGAGPAPGVRHLGALPHEQVLRWLRRAAVFAEPARYEPFGLAALEAGRSGCALVLGDIPSLREVWGEAAAYVDPEDPEALAGAINRLLRDPAALSGAARAASRTALRYSPEATAEAYLALLQELCPVPA